MATDSEKSKETMRMGLRNVVAILILIVVAIVSGMKMKEDNELFPEIVSDYVPTTPQNFLAYAIMFSILYGLIGGGVWFGFAEFIISKLP